MSYPPRPPMVPGMPMGMPFMGLPPGMPPGMPVGIPPPLMTGPPPSGGAGGTPMSYYPPPGGAQRPGMPGGPPPSMMPSNNNMNNRSNRHGHMHKSHNRDRHRDSDGMPHSMLQPLPNLGPPVTVFVGNITEKWPDAMIRQLLATCGQVLNWKRVQGASGKLQGFGFCDFNGPDAGLRAVRLLHDQEVGDKKLVVKVDAKTSTVLDEFKNERRKKKTEETAQKQENGESESAEGDAEKAAKDDKDNSDNDGEIKEESEDYMDDEMKEADERSRARISIIFREFKSELDAYQPPGDKPEKDTGSTKVQMQDKLHLLKLSSLEKAGELAENEEFPEDLALEEGKREIITREISNFRENMKQEKQKEEERKKHIRERREREKAREERRKEERDRSPIERVRRDRSRSPVPGFRPGVQSPQRIRRSGSRTDEGWRNRDRGDNRRDREDFDRARDRGRDRDRIQDQRDNRDKDKRRRSRNRRSRSMSRDRSPAAPPKPRYREREEEEEAAEQKRIERRAREKEAAYEERLRVWEAREAKKAKEIRREKDKLRRQDEDQQREAKRMKQFLEDYDDEKHDSKYYKGKELQRRLADRAKELEADNKDRQREREELEEIKLRMLTSNTSSPGGPNLASRFEKYKKPMSDSTNTPLSTSSSYGKSFGLPKSDAPSSISSRLQALAGGVSLPQKSKSNPITITTQNNGHSPAPRQPIIENKKDPVPPVTPVETVKAAVTTVPHTSTQRTSFDSIQFKNFVPIKSNPTTPLSIPSSPAVPQMSPSVQSLTGTGFQLSLNPGVSKERDTKDTKDVKEVISNPVVNDDSRTSFSPGNSPGMASPGNSRDYDDFSMQGISPVDAPKKKRIDVKDVFNQDEDDDGLGSARKRKLVPLDFGDESKKSKRDDKIPEDKKKHIKSLIDKIPTDKEALFAHEIDWDMLDTSLMERRIRPWINKKIIDYIGEPEPTLVEFICSKVLGRSAPQSILDDVMMVLDDEAEVFVVKMWRLLVYEIAAKQYGLSNKAP